MAKFHIECMGPAPVAESANIEPLADKDFSAKTVALERKMDGGSLAQNAKSRRSDPLLDEGSRQFAKVYAAAQEAPLDNPTSTQLHSLAAQVAEEMGMKAQPTPKPGLSIPAANANRSRLKH